MLDINRLKVDVAGKRVLDDINLKIDKGEVFVLFGPNGSGKSTLLKIIMGFYGYELVEGSIVFKGNDIVGRKVEERVKNGIGIMYQHPPSVTGVKLRQIAQRLTDDENKINEWAEKLELTEHLDRDINVGFSGGEMKRSELFQLMLQEPDLLLLDEPESGVDLENISIMGKVLNGYLSHPDKSALIITHTGYILDYVKGKKGSVLMDNRLWCVGEPKEMFDSIRRSGYEKCKGCVCPQKG
ncbi:MAG: ABC transporter ATP-binding protein [Candidatus Omnitrophica bacterium]|nr:ABC transporter ATP-binding protein [Candidatus Omnitrophota bacterium]MDD5080996.1 ABC transporter ATP-binding protein [Candidatus Omnitrophota bacterium]